MDPTYVTCRRLTSYTNANMYILEGGHLLHIHTCPPYIRSDVLPSANEARAILCESLHPHLHLHLYACIAIHFFSIRSVTIVSVWEHLLWGWNFIRYICIDDICSMFSSCSLTQILRLLQMLPSPGGDQAMQSFATLFILFNVLGCTVSFHFLKVTQQPTPPPKVQPNIEAILLETSLIEGHGVRQPEIQESFRTSKW